jgi:putative membrane protein
MSGGADPDSRIRTHLANERTFLAWLRTSLGLIVVGLGVAQFLERELMPGVPLVTMFALLLVGAGVVMTVAAGVHYERGRDQIERGTYRAASRAVIVAVGLVGVGGLLAMVLVLLLRQAG